MPDLFKTILYQSPTDARQSAFTYQSPENQTMFEFFAANPLKRQDFPHVMKVNSAQVPSWTDIHPTNELLRRYRPDRFLVVDVGGGTGAALERFRAIHPLITFTLCYTTGPMTKQLRF